MGEKKRDILIDAAKGIGIMLVVLGHCISHDTLLSKAIYSFHMPLFFFAAGYVSKENKWTGWLPLAARRFDGLLVPYLIYSSLYLIIGIGPGDIRSFLLGKGVSVTWFFTCLFVVEMLGAMIKSCPGSLLYRGVVILLCCLLSRVVDVAFLSALAFWLAGSWLAQSGKLKRIFDGRITTRLIVLLPLVALWLLFFFNDAVDVRICQYGNLALFYFSAIGGILMVWVFSSLLPSTLLRVLSLVGERSLLVMCLHLPVLWLSSIVVKPYCGRPVHLAASMVLLVAMVALMSRYLPFMSGKMKWTFKLINKHPSHRAGLNTGGKCDEQ